MRCSAIVHIEPGPCTLTVALEVEVQPLAEAMEALFEWTVAPFVILSVAWPLSPTVRFSAIVHFEPGP